MDQDAIDAARNKIDDARTELRKAFAAATTDVARAKIQEDLNKLGDLDDQITEEEIIKETEALNRLSDILDQAIKDIQNNVSNFFLGDLINLKNGINKKS